MFKQTKGLYVMLLMSIAIGSYASASVRDSEKAPPGISYVPANDVKILIVPCQEITLEAFLPVTAMAVITHESINQTSALASEWNQQNNTPEQSCPFLMASYVLRC